MPVARILVITCLLLALSGCNKSTQSKEPKSLIVGTWSGQYQNPSTDGKAAPSMAFDFEFGSDGSFRMGKRKVWVNGTYEFKDAKTFMVNIKGMPAGPYSITELSANRLVYERKLDNNQVQRTELTKQ